MTNSASKAMEAQANTDRAQEVLATSEMAAPPLDQFSAWEALERLISSWKLIMGSAAAAGVVTIGATFLVKPTYTSTAVFIPPQQQQGLAASGALNSLGTLGSIAASTGALKTPADQYVSLMRSTRILDRQLEKFSLLEVYGEDYKVDARRKLLEKSRFNVGKKDGLVTIEVDDHDPQRSADLANSYIDELRHVTSQLAVTEAQQRRAFFESQLVTVKNKLANAQAQLQASGFDASVLRTDPKATAEAYAKLQAELTAAELKLRMARETMTVNAPEMQQRSAAVAMLREKLSKAEVAASSGQTADFIDRYREFKYQESLFDIISRQFELAKSDESREGALIQVIDAATPPEKKSSPRRLIAGITASIIVGTLLTIYFAIPIGIRRKVLTTIKKHSSQ